MMSFLGKLNDPGKIGWPVLWKHTVPLNGDKTGLFESMA